MGRMQGRSDENRPEIWFFQTPSATWQALMGSEKVSLHFAAIILKTDKRLWSELMNRRAEGTKSEPHVKDEQILKKPFGVLAGILSVNDRGADCI